MHSVRSVLVCAALAGAVSASAAEPAATLRIKSAGDLFAAIRDATALAGRPFDGVMAECRFRMLVDAAGIELRDDEPILFAMKPKPVPADVTAVPFFDPPPFAFSIPMPPLSAGSLAVFGATNAPAPGEWIGGEGGAPCFSWRDGRAYFAVGEGGRALAEGLAAAPAPRSAGALFEVAVDEPLVFQEKLLAAEDGVAPGTPFSEVAANIAAALGVPGLAPRIEALFDVSRKNARDVERGVFDVWFDATNGFAFATAAVAREGSGLAARLAAVPALDPAALPAVPADAPFWGVSSRPDAGEDAEGVLKAVRALFEGPAPSGSAVATARREAAVRAVDALLAAVPAFRGAAAWLAADSAGCPALVVERLLADPAPPRAGIDAQAALLETFPGLASNGVAIVRKAPGDIRIEVDIENALVAAARLVHEYDLDEDDDELWIDDEDDDELWIDDDDEDTDDDDADDEDEDADDEDEDADDEDEEEEGNPFDEESVRAEAREIAEAIGKTVEIGDTVAADGSRERIVVCVGGAEIPEARGLPDLAPALALGAMAGDGARPVSACHLSLRPFVAAFLPFVSGFGEKSGNPIDRADLEKAEAFASGAADFRIRAIKAVEGRTAVSVCAVPREDVEAAATFFADAAEGSGEDPVRLPLRPGFGRMAP